MSNAKPMSRERRRVHFMWTDRQVRQFGRMSVLERRRASGELKHGASGVKVRKPKPGRPLWTPRGSIATHVAYHCAPCDQHDRPRMHRKPREVFA